MAIPRDSGQSFYKIILESAIYLHGTTLYFAHSYVQRSFISCDIITRNDNALIQQLMQDIKGVSYGNKLIRKLGF